VHTIPLHLNRMSLHGGTRSEHTDAVQPLVRAKLPIHALNHGTKLLYVHCDISANAGYVACNQPFK